MSPASYNRSDKHTRKCAQVYKHKESVGRQRMEGKEGRLQQDDGKYKRQHCRMKGRDFFFYNRNITPKTTVMYSLDDVRHCGIRQMFPFRVPRMFVKTTEPK